MIRITVDVNCPAWMAQGAKENIAMLLERYGDTKVVKIEVIQGAAPEQMMIGGQQCRNR